MGMVEQEKEVNEVKAVNEVRTIEVNNEIIITDVRDAEAMYNADEASFHVILSVDEKVKCLEEILSKVKKILYVYDKSQEEESNYNYKLYIGGILIYVSSSNVLFQGDLISVVVNLNAILINDFSKAQIKRIVFETRNLLEFMIKNYKEKYSIHDNEHNSAEAEVEQNTLIKSDKDID